jgi:tetratricopeptide (TPR) repeat protein
MRVSVLWVGCLLAVFLGGARGALAADDAAKARELFRKGQAHYAVGEYEAAAEAYMTAYKLKPDAALLYNAAQARRLGGKTDQALTLYRNYLRFYPEAKNAETVRGQIAKLEKLLEAERAAATAPPPAATAPPPVTPPVYAAPPPPDRPTLSATAPPPEPARKPIYKKVWFWGAVGGTVVAAAVVVALVAAGGSDPGPWNNLPDVRELRGASVARW